MAEQAKMKGAKMFIDIHAHACKYKVSKHRCIDIQQVTGNEVDVTLWTFPKSKFVRIFHFHQTGASEKHVSY